MSVVIDDISIEISARASNAANEIDALTKSLGSLRKKLSQTNIVGFNRQMMALNECLNQLSSANIDNIDRLANALERLSKVKGSLGFSKKDAKGVAAMAETVDINGAGGVTPQTSGTTRGNDVAGGIEETVEAAEKAPSVLDRVREKLHSFGKTSEKTSTILGKLAGAFKRIVFYRIIRTIVKEIGQAFREGTQNIAKYSAALNGMDSTNANGTMSELATSVLYLKNAFGTLAAPILSVVTPAIQWLVQQIVNAINVINQFIASLRGLSTFTKAKVATVDYAKSLDKASGSAKKLKNNLLGIDELNIISPDDSGGGGSSATNPLEMFEEAEVGDNPPWLKKLLDLVEKAKKAFLDGWNDVWDRLNIADRIEKVKGYIEGIKEKLAEIWNDPSVASARENFFYQFFYNLGRMAASLFSIGLSFAEFFLGGFNKFLEDNMPAIKQHLINMFDIGAEIMTQLGNLFEGVATIFMALGSDSGISFSASFIGVIFDCWAFISETFLKLVRDLLTIIVQPIWENRWQIEGAVEAMFGVLTNLIETFRNFLKPILEKLTNLYDSYLKPFFDLVAQGLTVIVGLFADTFTNYIAPLLNTLIDLLGILFDVWLKPMVDFIISIMGPAIDALGLIWQGLVDYISNVILIFDGFIAAADIVLSFVRDIFTVGIDEAFKNLKTNCSGYFDKLKESWNKAWEGMANGLKTHINTIIGHLNKMIEAINEAINFVIDAINSIEINIPDWVPVWGGNSWSPNLTFRASIPSIPLLASGGIIPSNGQMFISNEAGPELVGAFGNQTMVSNNEQIIAGIRSGVAEAVNGVLAPYLARIASDTNDIASKDYSITIGDDEIKRSYDRATSRSGFSFI